MYQETEVAISARLGESRKLINHISSLDAGSLDNSELLKIQKGFLFVSLYASIEYTLTTTVSGFLETLNHEQHKPMEFRKYLLCSVLDSKFKALIGSGKKRVWDKKKELFDALFSPEPACIDESVFPTDGINISKKQIEDIWTIFHLGGSPIPTEINDWILIEIKDHRNAIAHGREKAANIGGRYTVGVLQQRVSDVEIICFHILESFQEALEAKSYLHSDVG